MADWRAPKAARVRGDNCGGEYNSDGGTSKPSRDVAQTGGYAAKLTINGAATNNANGGQGVRLFRWCEAEQRGKALFYST